MVPIAVPAAKRRSDGRSPGGLGERRCPPPVLVEEPARAGIVVQAHRRAGAETESERAGEPVRQLEIQRRRRGEERLLGVEIASRGVRGLTIPGGAAGDDPAAGDEIRRLGERFKGGGPRPTNENYTRPLERDRSMPRRIATFPSV
jgi:hypothetical protein